MAEGRKIHIHWLYDDTDCELCGSSGSEGAFVTLDGEPLLQLVPLASCCSPETWSESEVFKEILSTLGFQVLE